MARSDEVLALLKKYRVTGILATVPIWMTRPWKS
jgi:hypothetical protein